MTTSTPITSEDSVAGYMRSIVASLPRSFSLGDGADAIAVLAGTGDWDARAAKRARAGVARILVLDPEPATADGVAALAASLEGTQLLLSETFAGNAAIGQLHRRGADVLDAADVFSLTGTVRGGVEPALLQQLRVLRELGVTGITVADAELAPRGALVTAHAERAGRPALVRLLVSCTRGAPVEHTVRVFSASASILLALPDSDTARPASATVTTPDGALRLPDIYEHAHRTRLRAFTDARGADEQVSHLIEDLRTLEAIAT